ncbi:heavy-metal-associated domain-containing protein [Verrucomicrobiota bacterium]
MRTSWLIVVIVACLAVVSCRQHDFKTVNIHVPEMKNKACAQIIANAVLRLPGVKRDEIVVDVRSRTITVTYDSLVLGMKNIEFAVAEAGFAANDIPAKQEAVEKLPLECK